MAMHPTAAAEREVGQPMQFFSHDGFDLAFLDRQPASLSVLNQPGDTQLT